MMTVEIFLTIKLSIKQCYFVDNPSVKHSILRISLFGVEHTKETYSEIQRYNNKTTALFGKDL